MSITVGGLPAKTRSRPAPPISAVSSSSTSFTTCWPGFSDSSTSAPSARSFTCAVNCLTTWKLTSASSSARRIARIAFDMSSSVSVPRERTSASADWRRSERVSSTAIEASGSARAAGPPRGLPRGGVVAGVPPGGRDRLWPVATRRLRGGPATPSAAALAAAYLGCRRSVASPDHAAELPSAS